MLNLISQQDTFNLAPPERFANLYNLQFGDLIRLGINLVLIIAAVSFFFILVIGGIKWITSGGDKGKTESARAQITAAFIGLLLVFAAWAILALLGAIFDINLVGDFDISP
jgi:hypothetical protein